MKVHSLPRGALGIPMPKPLDGEVNRKLQGGLPPVAFRSICEKFVASNAAGRARYSKADLRSASAKCDRTNGIAYTMGRRANGVTV